MSRRISRIQRCINRLKSTSSDLRRERAQRKIEIDWESYVYQSQWDTTHRMPPLTAVRVFADYFGRPGYQMYRDCSRCERDDKAPKTVTSWRPPGTVSRWACHGCAVSFLDQLGEEMGAVRDRLYREWIEAREALKDHQAGRRYKTTEAQKRSWRAQRDRLRDDLDNATEACKLSGFDPHRRARQRTRHEGVFPNEPLDSGVVSADFEPYDHEKLKREGVEK